MKHLYLYRFAFHPEWGTFGYMAVKGRTLYTVERPWVNNQEFVSCIPNGSYQLVLDPFRDRYMAPLLLDVPGRDQVQMHVANWAHQLEGCIAVGLGLGTLKGKWAVTDSMDAFEYLMSKWPFEIIHIHNLTSAIP